MPNFTDWNYDTGIATEYERIGECNQCGDCCRATFNIKMSEGYDKQFNGGKATDEKGRWSEIMEVSEISRIKGTREYTGFTLADRENPPCCALDPETNLCTKEEFDRKPWICRVFPTVPNDIKDLPNCSYEFIKIDEWCIEELEYA